MAAAALMGPASAYHPHSSTYTHPYSHHSPPDPMPGILGHGDAPRRAPKESESSSQQRQSLPSLPSISEMFNSKPSTYSPTTPTTATGPASLPPPPPPPAPPAPSSIAQPSQPPPHPSYTHDGPSRSDPGLESRTHQAGFSQRPEMGSTGPAFQYGDHREYARPTEPPQRNGSYSSSHGAPVPYPTPGQLPPGQLPLSQAPPISPRHAGPLMPPPYDAQRPPMHPDEEYAFQKRFDPLALNRQFESWGYTECLSRVMSSSRTVFNFAEAWSNIASEQHGGQPLPQRLPTDKEVSELIYTTEYLKKNLENIRDAVHNHSIASEKAREGAKHRDSFDDDDVSMYGDGMKQHYGLGEVKKRRGRAAPPGRCHSCNRIDTPEWRRGPDGARTLCNACGLHYAKLERKRQIEQRSMRSKAVE